MRYFTKSSDRQEIIGKLQKMPLKSPSMPDFGSYQRIGVTGFSPKFQKDSPVTALEKALQV